VGKIQRFVFDSHHCINSERVFGQGWEQSLVVGHLPSMCEALGLIPGTTKKSFFFLLAKNILLRQ
jgi:hypothetical protein